MNKVEILVGGGSGGDGVVSFRHERFVPLLEAVGWRYVGRRGVGGSSFERLTLSPVNTEDITEDKR